MPLEEACNWDAVGCETCDALDSLDTDTQDAIKAWAVDRLWKWTGRQYGPCEVTVRPCRRDCGSLSGLSYPALIGGRFTNVHCGSCSTDCSCKSISETLLPGPVDSIVGITVDGVTLDLTAVRVDDYSLLVRIDGGTWPICQDLTKLPTEDGTWSVTYTRGKPVPPGGDLIAGIFACELAKSICGDSTCRLPRRIRTIERQGVGLAVAVDQFEDLERGRTGIWEVDDWVVSQTAPRREGQIGSPDVPKQRRTTWFPADATTTVLDGGDAEGTGTLTVDGGDA